MKERSAARIEDGRYAPRREFFPLFCQRADSDHQKPRYQVQHICDRFRSEIRETGHGGCGGRRTGRNECVSRGHDG